MEADELSSEPDLEAIFRFLDANKSQLGDGDGAKDVVEAFVACFTEELFGDRQDDFSLTLGEFQSGRFDDVLDGAGGENLLGEICSTQLPLPIYVFVNRMSLDTFVDLKFGGDGILVPQRDKQSISPMDRSIGELLFGHVAIALNTTMSTFPWQATILTERFVSSSITDLPHTGENYEHISIEVENEGVDLEVMISFPIDLIEMFRTEAKPDSEEKKLQSNDPEWANHVEQEILQSRIALRALVAQQEFSIAEISKITVGQVLPINAKVDDSLPILGEDNVLFSSNIGQLNGSYAMRIVDVLEPIEKFNTVR